MRLGRVCTATGNAVQEPTPLHGSVSEPIWHDPQADTEARIFQRTNVGCEAANG